MLPKLNQKYCSKCGGPAIGFFGSIPCVLPFMENPALGIHTLGPAIVTSPHAEIVRSGSYVYVTCKHGHIWRTLLRD